MKLYALLGLMIMLFGCSHSERLSSPSGLVTKIPPREVAPGSQRSHGVAFELIGSEKLILHFKNVDTLVEWSLSASGGVFISSLPAGHWELIGIERLGLGYRSMNISRKFVIATKSGHLNYGGSIIIGCPQIGSRDLKHLKNMKFFNRYPFSSPSGLCEVVIGNNLASVRRELKKLRKSRKLRIHMSF